MKYIRSFDSDSQVREVLKSPSRDYSHKPLLYRVGESSHISYDDPRKHENSFYVRVRILEDQGLGAFDPTFKFSVVPEVDREFTCTVDWGDGTVETLTAKKDKYNRYSLSHTYPSAGEYEMEMYDCSVRYDLKGDPDKSYQNMFYEYHQDFYRGYSTKAIRICIPSFVKSIGKSTFSQYEDFEIHGDDLVSPYTVPYGVKEIGDYAWEGCYGLYELNLPESIKSIDSYVVKLCENLKEFIIPDSCETIAGLVVIGCTKLKRIHIGKSLKSIRWIYFTKSVEEITCNPDNQYFMVRDGLLCDKSGSSLIAIPPSLRRDIVIPEGVTTLGSNFGYHGYPTDVRAAEGIEGASVTQEQIDQFSNNYHSLSLPSTFISLNTEATGGYTFHGMTELESISVHPDNPKFTSQDGLLYTKSMDTIVGYPTGKRRYNPGTEVIPEGVKTIAPTVFADTYWLESISFPSTLESIGKWAFEFYGFVENTDYIPRLNTIYSYAMTAPTLGEEAFVSIPSNGTLHIKAGATGYDAWLNAGLTGWTIVEDL